MLPTERLFDKDPYMTEFSATVLFWKQAEGCTYRGKTGCYYISAQKPPAAVSECDGCPYGRASPCIGWCTKELLRSIGLWPSAITIRRNYEPENQQTQSGTSEE